VKHVPHYSRLSKVVIDAPAAEHDQELAFWQAATGQTFERSKRFPEYHSADLEGDLGMLVQRLDEGSGRVHLDVHTDDLEAEVARLESLGATRVRKVHRWWIMRDTAGLPFCVIPEALGALHDGNAHRWE
jgi:hypothetical protein